MFGLPDYEQYKRNPHDSRNEKLDQDTRSRYENRLQAEEYEAKEKARRNSYRQREDEASQRRQDDIKKREEANTVKDSPHSGTVSRSGGETSDSAQAMMTMTFLGPLGMFLGALIMSQTTPFASVVLTASAWIALQLVGEAQTSSGLSFILAPMFVWFASGLGASLMLKWSIEAHYDVMEATKGNRLARLIFLLSPTLLYGLGVLLFNFLSLSSYTGIGALIGTIVIQFGMVRAIGSRA